ncbi:MAG: acyl-ACP--UDP-N-acetylglucosamine O-acyltransferase [Acidobacteria bacterium]|nr:acyl-ACP--UDP-N-acetylglucosamine O-acyltransferase [Acidobacteriota bacterium]
MRAPVEIASTAIISPYAKIASDVSIGPFCVIEDEVEIGAGTRLDSHVIIKRYTTLGEENHLYPGVVLGNDPEDKHFSEARSFLKVGNRNVFREYSSASRGTPQDSATIIGDGNYVMIGVHIAHNCHLGDNIVICNNCSLGGYVEIEDGAFLSANVLVHQFSKIGRLAMVSGNTRVNQDVPPYVLASDFKIAARGLNLVGLKRAGFSRETIGEIKKAYQILYRSHLPLRQALERIESELPGEEARHLVEFVRRSERGICRDFRSDRSRQGGQVMDEGDPAQA